MVTTSRQAGFTLIELMCVVAIIGLLAVIAIPLLSENKPRAHDGVAKSNLRTAYSSAKAFAASNDGSFMGFTPQELENDQPAFKGTLDRSVLVPGKTADPRTIVLMDPTRDDIELCNASKGRHVFCIWDDGTGARYSFGETVASLNPYSPNGWIDPITVASLPPTSPGSPGGTTPTGTPVAAPGGGDSNPTTPTAPDPTGNGGNGDPSNPADPSSPADPSNPGRGGTNDPNNPGNPGNPGGPTNPGGSTNPADKDRAAENAGEGVAKYIENLTKDPQYWTRCIDRPAGVTSDPSDRAWKTVESGQGQYTILLLPANGASKCDPNDPSGTVRDKDDGTVTIEVTGKGGGETTTIRATFRRKGFIDYAYFTDYETSDPDYYKTFAYETRPAISTWANGCVKYYRNGRANVKYSGQLNYFGTWVNYNTNCSEIQFTTGDYIAGPIHTNDEILVCGTPTFGRTKTDKVEISGNNWRGSNCTDNIPKFNGTFIPKAPVLSPPKTNDALKAVATSNYRFSGKTTIVFNGDTMVVNGAVKQLPANGVIYVDGTGDCGYDFYDPYSNPNTCGDVYVSGTTNKAVTVAAANDVVITGNLRSGANSALIGLIGNGYVRIYHPVNRDAQNATQCTNNGGPGSITVDAALLALNHSFVVDNYYCGAPLGTLTLKGSVAQSFRGPVGTGNGSSVVSGYLKAYTYDDRLKLDIPPSFLDPLETVWGLIRTELVQDP